jgi:hypothetical protein
VLQAPETENNFGNINEVDEYLCPYPEIHVEILILSVVVLEMRPLGGGIGDETFGR